MSLRVYAVCIPEMRTAYHQDDPPDYGVPCGIFVAHSHEQARWLALGAWAYRGPDIGVNTDDYKNIRARVIAPNNARLEVGEYTDTHGDLHDYFWSRWPKEWTNL